MALVISVALLKGGVSKTTTAVALAEAAALSVPTVLVDTDPMGSAIRWRDLATAAGQPLRSDVVGLPAAGLGRRLDGVVRGASVVIVDSPPPGALEIARSTLEVADLVVMPCPPNLADLDRVPATMKLAADCGTPASAVLTQVRAGIAERAEAAVTLKSWGVNVYRAELPLTVSVQRAYGQPLMSGPLLRFGIDLMSEILEGMS